VLLKAVVGLAVTDIFLRAARLGSVVLRTEAPHEEAVDAPRRAAELLDRAPEALGAGQRPWNWATAALAALVVVSGMGVLRRSETMRRAAIGLVGVAAALSVGLTIHSALTVIPVYAAWVADLRDLVQDFERQGVDLGPGLAALLRTDRSRVLAWEGALQSVHLTCVGLLLLRLAGRSTRRWCSVAAPGPAAPGQDVRGPLGARGPAE
jgi:hypothetical protein